MDTTVAFPQSGVAGGQTVPVKAIDLEDGTFALAIGADLTLDPTNLALASKQDTGNTALAALVTSIGSIGDAAWSGTGNGTVIAILKAIAVNTTPTP